MIQVNTLMSYPKPRKSGLNGVESATYDTSHPAWYDMIIKTNPDDMCNAWRSRNKIKELALEIPHAKFLGLPVGRWLCAPFSKTPNHFDEKPFVILYTVIQFLVMCIFIVLFLALLGFRVVSGTVVTALALIFYGFFIIYALWVGPDPSLILILTYATLLGASIIKTG